MARSAMTIIGPAKKKMGIGGEYSLDAREHVMRRATSASRREGGHLSASLIETPATGDRSRDSFGVATSIGGWETVARHDDKIVPRARAPT
jgi:hypothetical protein